MSILGGLLRAPLVCVAVGGLGAATAGAAESSALGGQVTTTGTDGRDAIEVEFDIGTGAKGNSVTITPAATVTATSGSCAPQTDPLTGRPVRNECQISQGGVTLLVDLRKGDDLVDVNDRDGLVTSSRVTGGLGNDVITLRSFGDRILQGDDGNDQLAAPGELFNSGPARPAAYDGGPGTDTALLDGTQAPNDSTGGSETNGVTASLVSKTAIFAGLNHLGQQTTFRTDTLNGIEALVGTDVGDVLTGGTAADTLTGGDGNDNLRARLRAGAGR